MPDFYQELNPHPGLHNLKDCHYEFEVNKHINTNLSHICHLCSIFFFFFFDPGAFTSVSAKLWPTLWGK